MGFFKKLFGIKNKVSKETLVKFGLEKWAVTWKFSDMNPAVRSRTKPACRHRRAEIEINKDMEGTYEIEELIEGQLKSLLQIEESICAWEARYEK